MKNILFFLTPKAEVAYIKNTCSIRQALEKMYNHKYTAVPIISEDGKYVGTVTEGDFLYALKEANFTSIEKIEQESIDTIKRNRDNKPVDINAQMDDLIDGAMNQNFVPVVMDDGVFIGIVTRKSIIGYLRDNGRE